MGSNYSLPGIVFFQYEGVKDFCRPGFVRHQKSFKSEDTEVDMTSRVALVTGANSGLGFETALALARRNADVHMVCRDSARGEEAVKKIVAETNSKTVFLHIVDVSQPTAVKKFADSWTFRLDVLINNAGVLLSEPSNTSDGIETTFATNTLAPFLLTELFLPVLQQSGQSRVINVVSGGMYTVNMDADDPENRQTSFSGSKLYSICKRQLMCLTELWALKHAGSGVFFSAMHPGWARTPGTTKSLPSWFDKMPLRDATEGADTIVWLATCPRLRSDIDNGKLWFDREPVSTHMPLAHTKSSPDDVNKLYDYCAKFLREL